jgi:Cu2+-exporting ATPase
MVSDAAATKAPIAKIADRVSGVFVPAVIGIAVITTLAWLIGSREIGYALARGISVLVISCPCALGLATPVAIMVGNGVGAKNGILFKTAASLEETGKAAVVVLDKTGTITTGEPRVTDVLPAEGVTEGGASVGLSLGILGGGILLFLDALLRARGGIGGVVRGGIGCSRNILALNRSIN